MALRWHGSQEIERLRLEIGKDLLRAAVFFQAQHRKNLSVSNPRPHTTPSKPGEYPRLRTGLGRAGVEIDPANPKKIGDEGEVRIGYLKNVSYMLILELRRKRLGLVETFKKIKPQLSAIIEAS